MLRNLLFTILILLLSVGIFWFCLTSLDPLGAQRFSAFVAFFFSLFSGVSSLFLLIFFFSHELFSGRILGTRDFLVAMRRGILVGVLLSTLFVLQMFRMLGWLEFLLLTSFLVVVELIAISSREEKKV